MDPTALGRYLRESREAKELTLEDAVRALRIRREILESFEQGEFNVMDSTVRVRGMLRNYAHYLALEEERVLQYYEASLEDKRRNRRFSLRQSYVSELEPIAPKKITDTPPSLPAVRLPTPSNPSGGFSAILRNIAMILVSLAALAVIMFVVMDTLDLSPNEPNLTIGDAVTPAESATVTPTNTATITPRATILTDTPVFVGIDGIQVVLEMNQRSWVRVIVDNVERQTGVLEPGTMETFQANERISITAANAAALDITFNGVSQDDFGARGQQVELIFTGNGLEMIQGEGGAATEIIEVTPTPLVVTAEVTEELPTSNDEANAETSASVAEAQATPTATIIQFSVSTPTPLFANINSQESSAEEQSEQAAAVPDTAIPATASPAQATENVEQSEPTEVAPTASPTIANTPTPAAVLPIRATPDNPTPTKTG